MTLTIDLTPEQSVRLQQAAKARGIDAPAVVRDLIEHLPETTEEPTSETKEKPDYSHLEGYGALAGVLSVDKFLQEKHEEFAREEARDAERGASVKSLPKREQRKREILLRFAKYRGVGGSVDEFLKNKHEELAKEEAEL